VGSKYRIRVYRVEIDVKGGEDKLTNGLQACRSEGQLSAGGTRRTRKDQTNSGPMKKGDTRKERKEVGKDKRLSEPAEAKGKRRIGDRTKKVGGTSKE